MNNLLQQEHQITDLDPALLTVPFKLQTNWHVITGASCSGKTTLIKQLAEKGFQTIPEVSRQYLEGEIAKGRAIEEIRGKRVTLTRHIHNLMIRLERGLLAAEFTFFDRALPDCFAYYRLAGLCPNEILPECFHHRYASVFMLDRLPYQKDGVRTGNDARAGLYDAWIANDYRALGYNIVRVPVLPPDKRLDFVLEKLCEQGLM